MATTRRRPRRVDEIPPDGFLTELRGVFGLDADVTWADILHHAAHVERRSRQATADFFVGEGNAAAALSAIGPDPEALLRVSGNMDFWLRLCGLMTAGEFERALDGTVAVLVLLSLECRRRFPDTWAKWDAEVDLL